MRTQGVYDSIETLTQAQLHRDFAARLERPPAAARQDILGHIDRLHLHQILMKRELPRAGRRGPGVRVCRFRDHAQRRGHAARIFAGTHPNVQPQPWNGLPGPGGSLPYRRD